MVLYLCSSFFSSRRRHTRCSRDWSSDVCSSDLSAEARAHFLEGLREFDLGRLIDANVHFKAAVAADPDFGFAYLNVANTANSLDEFKTNLALAEQNAAGASEAERLQIQMTRKGFDNDLAGQLALGQQLVAKYPQDRKSVV